MMHLWLVLATPEVSLRLVLQQKNGKSVKLFYSPESIKSRAKMFSMEYCQEVLDQCLPRTLGS